MNNYIILIVGASGTGKTTIAKELERMYHLKSVQSYTTRPRRHEGETGHIFVTDEEFDKLKDDMCAYTLFDGYRYCATNQQIEESDVYIIDPNGVESLKQHYIGNKKLITVELIAKKKVRKKRMLKRGDNKAQVKKRLKHDKAQFKNFEPDIVVNVNSNIPSYLAQNLYLMCKCKSIA